MRCLSPLTLTCLADPAALGVAVSVEGEQALGTDKVLDGRGVWEGVLNADVVVLLHLVEQAICLRVEAAGVQAVDTRDWGVCMRDDRKKGRLECG
jgi:hypothetical protein